MIILIGAIIVFASVLGGFVMGGGHPGVLLHINELLNHYRSPRDSQPDSRPAARPPTIRTP